MVKAAVGPVAPPVNMEDFNKAAVILDLDGNGWSDRWARLLHFNTFVLKQVGWCWVWSDMECDG